MCGSTARFWGELGPFHHADRSGVVFLEAGGSSTFDVRKRQNGWCLIRSYMWQACAGKYGKPWPQWPPTQTDTSGLVRCLACALFHSQTTQYTPCWQNTGKPKAAAPKTWYANFENAKVIRGIAASSRNSHHICWLGRLICRQFLTLVASRALTGWSKETSNIGFGLNMEPTQTHLQVAVWTISYSLQS